VRQECELERHGKTASSRAGRLAAERKAAVQRLCSEQVRQDSEQEGWSFSSRDWKAAVPRLCSEQVRQDIEQEGWSFSSRYWKAAMTR
jgi:hypothetical protein